MGGDLTRKVLCWGGGEVPIPGPLGAGRSGPHFQCHHKISLPLRAGLQPQYLSWNLPGEGRDGETQVWKRGWAASARELLHTPQGPGWPLLQEILLPTLSRTPNPSFREQHRVDGWGGGLPAGCVCLMVTPLVMLPTHGVGGGAVRGLSPDWKILCWETQLATVLEGQVRQSGPLGGPSAGSTLTPLSEGEAGVCCRMGSAGGCRFSHPSVDEENQVHNGGSWGCTCSPSLPDKHLSPASSQALLLSLLLPPFPLPPVSTSPSCSSTSSPTFSASSPSLPQRPSVVWTGD